MNQIPPVAAQSVALDGAPAFAWLRRDKSDLCAIAGDLAQLTKARLTSMVLVSTFVGFWMGSGNGVDWARLANTLVGTGLVAGGAAVLNQVMEMDADALMERTRNRPLPAGRAGKSPATILGIGMSLAGLACLGAATTLLAASLATVTLFVYLAIYTPMKRRSSLSVPLGAVSGAIPPLIGWTAAAGSFGLGAWVLFGVQFAWQIPHFLSVAWMYRAQYAGAGFKMLRECDVSGLETAAEAFLFSLLLTAVTLIPVAVHAAGERYLAGSLAADCLIVGCAARFLFRRSQPAARQLFFASILYLPILLGSMILSKY